MEVVYDAVISWLKDTNAQGLDTYGNALAVAILLAAVLALIYVVFTAKRVLAYPLSLPH